MDSKQKAQIQVESRVAIEPSQKSKDQNQMIRALFIWVYVKLVTQLLYVVIRGFLIAIPLDQNQYLFNPFLVFLIINEFIIALLYLLGYMLLKCPDSAKNYFLLFSPMSLFDLAYYLFLILWYNQLIH